MTLNNALSGLFCASLNFIDATRTTTPRMTFQPASSMPNTSSEDLYLLHGTLPREVVCTENLTPFLKLLPCKGKAGIASLLDGHKLFDASWQSMAIDVRSVCAEDGSECSIEMEQTVDMVLDVDRSKRPRGMIGGLFYVIFIVDAHRQSNSTSDTYRAPPLRPIQAIRRQRSLLPFRRRQRAVMDYSRDLWPPNPRLLSFRRFSGGASRISLHPRTS